MCIIVWVDRKQREAEADKLRLTPEYLKLALIEAIANNTKIFFGDKIPSMFMNWSEETLNKLTKP